MLNNQFFQNFDFFSLDTPENLSLPLVFLIGVVASLSTCTASVGGLVLSLSATYAQLGKKAYLPLIKFHISRLITFFVLGGILGYLGSFFELSQTLNLIINTLPQFNITHIRHSFLLHQYVLLLTRQLALEVCFQLLRRMWLETVKPYLSTVLY